MAAHSLLTQNTGVQVYFAHPHSPWECGINENTNGLLRQYFPKGSDLSVHSHEHLDAVAWRLNTSPRKSLAWMCPAELFLPEGSFDAVAYWKSILNSSQPSVALLP
jgi:transposase, IS30 family